MERQTVRLRSGAAARQEEVLQAQRAENAALLAELRQVRRAVEQQKQLRLTEDGLER